MASTRVVPFKSFLPSVRIWLVNGEFDEPRGEPGHFLRCKLDASSVRRQFKGDMHIPGSARANLSDQVDGQCPYDDVARLDFSEVKVLDGPVDCDTLARNPFSRACVAGHQKRAALSGG